MTTTKATTTKANVKPKPGQPATTKRAHKPAPKATEPTPVATFNLATEELTFNDEALAELAAEAVVKKPAKSKAEPKEPKYPFTADDIAKLRDEDQNSWARVADLLELGSPGAARRAYSALVRPHKASVLTARTGSASGRQPVDFRDLDVAALAAYVGRVWFVQRQAGNVEEITCAKVTKIANGTIDFTDGNGKRRSVKAATVVAVK